MGDLKPLPVTKKVDKEARAARKTRSVTINSRTSRSRAKAGSSPEEIIEEAWQTDFLNETSSQVFEFRHKEKLIGQKSGKEGILHHLANKGANRPDSETKIPRFLHWFLGKYCSSLEIKDAKDYTPLHIALTENNTSFVGAVLDEPGLRNLDKVLLESCQFGNSLHLAIKYNLDVDRIEKMIEICSDSEKLLGSDKGKDGNTPLHTVMDMSDDEYHNEDKDNNSSEENESSHSELSDEEEDDDRNTAASLEEADWVEPVNSTRSPDEVGPLRSTKASRGLQRYSLKVPEADPSSSANRKDPNSTRTAGAARIQKVVEMLVLQNDSVLKKQNGSKRTPYQERIHHLLRRKFLRKENVGYDDEKDALRNPKFRGIVARDPVAAFIRSYCMRKFSRDKIMECLYQPGQGTLSYKIAV